MTTAQAKIHTPADDPDDLMRRIGVAWRELRRGGSMTALLAHVHGDGPPALDLGQVDTLDLLAQQGSCRMSDLAEVLRVDPSTATRAVDRLVQAGLARRQRSGDDARVVRVVLTPMGRRRHDALLQRRRSAMEKILEGFDGRERQQLAELLERLVTGVDTFVAATRPPHAD